VIAAFRNFQMLDIDRQGCRNKGVMGALAPPALVEVGQQGRECAFCPMVFSKVRSMNIVKFISAIKVSSNVRICRRLFCRVYLTLSAMKFSIVTELYRNFL